MQCSTEAREGVTLFHAAGDVDHASAGAFEQALLPMLAELPAGSNVVLDLAGVDYMSSVGLRVLMLAAKQGKSAALNIRVAALGPSLLEIFQISRFDRLFTVHDDVDAAVAAFRSA